MCSIPIFHDKKMDFVFWCSGVLVERGRRKGTDKGADCSSGNEARGAGGGRKGSRAERKEATSRPERENCARGEAEGGVVTKWR